MGFLKSIGVSGFLDIALMAVLIYTLLVWFKRSKAVFVLVGLVIVGIVYNTAREFNLQLTAAVFQGFFTVILIAIIVIFQEEIKHLFERVAVWSLTRGVTRQQVMHLSRKEVEILLRSVTDLAHEKVGALIILRGQDAIVRHIDGGWDLNGEMSEPLLKSLFDPHSLGHDGALIIDGNRILQFGCHLPLSKDLKKIQPGGGTRHAAALGLSELTDAFCLVVSEERGTISVARDGDIQVVSDPELLNLMLERFYDEINPAGHTQTWFELLTKNFREKIIAVLLTLGLWFFYVHEGRLTYKTFSVPVEYVNLPSQLQVNNIFPAKVEVTLSGPRRFFYFINEKQVKVVLNMINKQEGFEIRPIQKSNISFPEKLSLENVAPAKVKLLLVLKPTEN